MTKEAILTTDVALATILVPRARLLHKRRLCYVYG
jgi:hypothetical protein